MGPPPPRSAPSQERPEKKEAVVSVQEQMKTLDRIWGRAGGRASLPCLFGEDPICTTCSEENRDLITQVRHWHGVLTAPSPRGSKLWSHWAPRLPRPRPDQVPPEASPVPSASVPSASVPSASVPSVAVASMPVTSMNVASMPGASAPVASAHVASAHVAPAHVTSAHVASAHVASAHFSSTPVAFPDALGAALTPAAKVYSTARRPVIGRNEMNAVPYGTVNRPAVPETVRGGTFDARFLQRYCEYCFRNGENASMYESHSLRNPVTQQIVCPRLNDELCQHCGDCLASVHSTRECPIGRNLLASQNF